MRVAVSGASGLVGSAVCQELLRRGHAVVRLARKTSSAPDEALYDPIAGVVDLPALGVVDGIVHLAGEPIKGRWTAAKKSAVMESRVRGTDLIARTAAQMGPRPRVMVTASAYGIYGDRGNELLTEDSPTGGGFLGEVGSKWEAAALPAQAAGIRVVHARFGMVLSPDGGALAAMKLPWQLGLGARLGSGRQWWPWITLEDAARAVCIALENEALAGPVNVVAPEQVTNAQFTRALGREFSRPALLFAPAWAVKLMFGEAGKEMFLASQRIAPARLKNAGFEWKSPTLAPALKQLLRTRDA